MRHVRIDAPAGSLASLERALFGNRNLRAEVTRLYFRKGWDDLRFSEAAVRRDALSRVVLRGR